MTLTRSLNPTIVEPTKSFYRNPLLVGSEVSGAELGRTDYGPIFHNYNTENKGVTTINVSKFRAKDQNH